MKIAVIGGGIFGCTAALYAARDGHEVHLYERHGRLLMEASGRTQGRMHQGFHYPRSPATAQEARQGYETFRFEYGAALWRHRSLYCVARDGSLTTADDFLAFCRAEGLAFRIAKREPCVNLDAVDVAIAVEEPRCDLGALQAIVEARLDAAGVSVLLDTHAGPWLRDDYDAIVVATYAGQGHVLASFGLPVPSVQYEVVENVIVEMPKWHGRTSVAVMDGPFGGVDPVSPSARRHLLSHVALMVHARNVGPVPDVPEHLKAYVNNGVTQDGPTRFVAMRDAVARYVPYLAMAEYVGSLYTIRAVLPGLEGDDARPTLVERLDDQVIRIFSGKIGTACDAAARCRELLVERSGETEELHVPPRSRPHIAQHGGAAFEPAASVRVHHG